MRKPSSESSGSVSQLKIKNPGEEFCRQSPDSLPLSYIVLGSNHFLINILVSYLATKNVVRASRVCSSLSQSGFSLDSAFFPFAARCCFMAILKSSADTNVGQNRNLTHCTKSLYRYNLSLSIFKRSLLFVRQSLTNAISLPLIHSISSKHVFTAVSDFSNRKKNHFKPDTSGSIFPTPPRQRSIPHPRDGLICEIPDSPGYRK